MNEDPIEPNDDGDDPAARELVRRALAMDDVTKRPPDILRGVQRRLRVRSRGKFFADGWSTSAARHAYIVAALITLLLVVITYYVLSPLAFR